MSERDDEGREFDLKWAEGAAHKEPSARARMLAARWKENPPGPVPFRAEPEHRGSAGHHRPWVSTVLVLGCVVAVILLLGYAGIGPY
ncbi:SCO2583/SCO2584 N-terminal domain-containing protein [Streptomyces sp. GESEQ-13]|uniref:SCO2583/SCO2584 N-terminal domain-containing protein n=1 Tax=Streptomyces sp. GESEQ-13 TaxID=2812654 RepID=UPI001B332D0B